MSISGKLRKFFGISQPVDQAHTLPRASLEAGSLRGSLKNWVPQQTHLRSQQAFERDLAIARVDELYGLVMLLAFYYTGARRGEIFRLTWADVDLQAGIIRLTDHKGGSGKKRTRWLPLHPTLVDALRWWQEARPCMVDNVFMRLESHTHMGEPFTERNKLMPRLCERAGVKPFGFHAIRHKAAPIAFMAGGLNAAQQLMGHARATTTDIYVRSAGLYADKQILVDALGDSGIGVAANALFTKMPHEKQPHEAFCKQENVNNILQ